MKCNQCSEECDNENCEGCKACEYTTICLCTRKDKTFIDTIEELLNKYAEELTKKETR